VLRLAQALARLRFAASVLHADVDEALRLMEASKESLRDDDGEGDAAGDADRSDTSRVYRIIKDMAQGAAAAAAGDGRRATRRRAQKLGRGPDGERDYGEEENGEEGALDVLSMVDIRARVLRAGYTETQLMTTIQEVRTFGRFSFILVVDAECSYSLSLCSTRISISGRAWPTVQS
jgi:DNA replication licensing factor MCM7